MSRILVLIIFLIWLAWDPASPPAPPASALGLPIFLGFYGVLVLLMGLYARMLARRVTASNFDRNLRRFHFAMDAARILIPAWFGVGILFLGWRWMVDQLLGGHLPIVSVPGVILGTLPALLAWAGLWWSQFPADQALREQNILCLLDAGLPHHAPPRFEKYFLSNLRLQFLFLGVPLLLIVLGHDLAQLAVKLLDLHQYDEWIDILGWVAPAGIVFFFAPEIIRRVLHTEPLPDSPLRRRLDALCRRTGVRYRDVLLWKTDHNMGNAAVMGFVPRFRYILLSDLLLERMPDEEIEAVFAHEMGHIVHRHMAWYVIFILVLTLLNAGPGRWLTDDLAHLNANAQQIICFGVWVATFMLLFGFISRRFERQADVYGARTIQMNPQIRFEADRHPALEGMGTWTALANSTATFTPAVLTQRVEAPVAPPASASAGESFVGHYGATTFGSALRRVANVNNIPVAARSWCHGSIARRMQYLHSLSADPDRTARFDRWMLGLYGSILAALAVSILLFVVTQSQ